MNSQELEAKGGFYASKILGDTTNCREACFVAYWALRKIELRIAKEYIKR